MRAAEIALLLPEVLRRTVVPGSPMSAILAVMEDLHAPAEEVLAEVSTIVDPLRTPDRFVEMLAAWVDLQRWNASTAGRIETDRLRLLVAMSARVGSRRGTARGLLEVLTVATGIGGIRVDEAVPSMGPGGAPDGLPRPFHFRVAVPPGGESQLALITELVEQEKPAHVTAEVIMVETADPGDVS